MKSGTPLATFVAAAVAGSAATAATEDDWAIPSASGRLRIERAENSPWPADTGIFRLWPDAVHWGGYRVCILAGETVASEVYWTDDDGPVSLRLDTGSRALAYRV